MNIYQIRLDELERYTKKGSLLDRQNICIYTLGETISIICEESIDELTLFAQSAPGEDIYFVMQKGASFRLENPTVNIVADHGRYLFISADKADVPRLLAGDHCWVVEKLKPRYTVFEKFDLAIHRAAERTSIPAPAARIEKSNFKTQIEYLASFRDRYALNQTYMESADYCQSYLENLGYQVQLQSFSLADIGQPNLNTANVIATKKGTSATAKKVLVTAHLDSINILNRENGRAPGADDNASGSAGVLELARAFGDTDHVNDLILILFGAEELGLIGSRHYVDLLTDQPDNYLCVINMDMIGQKNTQNLSVLLEGAEVSRPQIEKALQLANGSLNLEIRTSYSPFASDHVPFIDKGISAFLTIEGEDSANSSIHTENDLLEKIDYDLAVEILRLNALLLNHYLKT